MGFLGQHATKEKEAIGYREDVLTKAIDKAKAGGWYPTLDKPIKWYTDTGNYYNIIFNKDFGIAFFGTQSYSYDMPDDNQYCSMPAWQHHLRKMVIAEEPLSYLREFLN